MLEEAVALELLQQVELIFVMAEMVVELMVKLERAENLVAQHILVPVAVVELKQMVVLLALVILQVLRLPRFHRDRVVVVIEIVKIVLLLVGVAVATMAVAAAVQVLAAAAAQDM